MELYIHIPFCVRKCAYCSFASFPSCNRKEMERYVCALIREASLRRSFLKEKVETVYIGGGTPSLLPPDLVFMLLKCLKSEMDFSSVKEFTVEANPGTVTPEWLEAILPFGANRLSFGVQASQDRLLNLLGRIHRFGDVVQSVHMARQFGIKNINMDLIFGLPTQTADDWKQTLNDVLSISPDHISAYGLIPEEGTSLFQALENGTLSLPDPDLERNMYDCAISMLHAAGLYQYEISNFASPGKECRHNIGYWTQVPYLGLGLSAASMIRCPDRDNQTDPFSIRWTNPSSFDGYYAMLEQDGIPEEIKETISPEEARFETVMLSLRMTSGMHRGDFLQLHGEYPEKWYGEILYRLKGQGLLELRDDSWCLTRRGMDLQNSVLVEFMN